MPTKNIASNAIALIGSWVTTFTSAIMQNVGFSWPALTGDADLLTITSGLAASSLTFALARRRWKEADAKLVEANANAEMTKASARKVNAEAKVIEISNRAKELLNEEKALVVAAKRAALQSKIEQDGKAA